MKIISSTFLSPVLIASSLLAGGLSVHANPTGGQVAAGAASINTAPGTVLINQASNTAIINWQTFSIGAGELTKFVQPSSTSATLNRVLGGQTSIIDGTLGANGQIYLINGNGILVGPDGKVNTAGFLASTRDIEDADFLSGNLHFTGSNNNGVKNPGTISAIGGDVILIGKTVDNEGTISAPLGHAGLAAADDVLITQSGMEQVFVRAVSDPTSAAGKTGVNNSGAISAASAELKAANGNIYALATNNSGLIRATGVANKGGHIWLVAEGNQGVTQNTGQLVARKANGKGGAIETSGEQVIAQGTVDAGNGGSWLVDPSNININAPTAATIVTSLNAGTAVTENSTTGTGGTGNITVASPIVWTGTGTLNLDAYANLNINAAITGNSGTLNVESGTGAAGTISATAAVSALNFALQAGSWVQNSPTLPAFSATHFTITSGSFLRAAGGSGVAGDPYQITDVYGLQGIGSSATYEAASWLDTAAINASGTSGWNAGAGFVPISNFTGTFNGNGNVGEISGLSINLPGSTNVGLFGQVGAGGTVNDAILSGATITGKIDVGTLVGENLGTVLTSSAAGTVTGVNNSASINIGGLVGLNSGNITSSFATAAATGYSNVGGLAGNNGGTIQSSDASGAVNSFHAAGSAGNSLGGLVGMNGGGTIALSYATGSVVTAADSTAVGGLVGNSTGAGAVIQQSYAKGVTVTGLDYVGGLVGADGTGQVVASYVIDGASASSVTGTQRVGGLLGFNAGTVTQSYVVSTGSIRGQDNATLAQIADNIGGLVGENEGGGSTISSSYANVTVGEIAGTTDAAQAGGLVGQNDSGTTVTSSYASGNVTGLSQVGGLVGWNQGTMGVQSNASGTVNGTTNVGGLVGENTGTVNAQSFATGQVTGVTAVGGLIGLNNTAVAIANVFAQGNVSGTTNVGGLVGSNTQGNFSTSNATGTVTGGTINIGGLMGQNAATITVSFATGNVTAASAGNVGGLVGNNSGTIGLQSTASGTVLGGTSVGGLVGTNSGTVGDAISTVEALTAYTNATGPVTGGSLVGGLIGDNSGTVQQTSASGAVKGKTTSSTSVGGLVGSNETTGTITVSFSSSTVYGNGTASTNGADTDKQIGGLAGANLGAIGMSYANGAVVGDNATGGLVGLQNAAGAEIQTSYSTGNVTGLASTGGLVGQNELGLITQNYSISTVLGTTAVGGLVGLNQASISENYATGAVNGGTNDVGGLVGDNAAGAFLTQSYATGAVTGVGSTGGLLGLNSGTVANSYWDENSTTQGTKGIGNDPSNTGATGLTSTGGSPTAFSTASYAGFGTAGAVVGGASNAVEITDATPKIAWYLLSGATRPYLAWEAPINNPVISGAHVIYTAHQLQLMAVDLGASYVLGKSIDLSETQQASELWNTATGFAPIGTIASPFTGSLGGGGFGITNLFVDTPTISGVGLFGASSGTLSGISLSGNVTGLNDVGLLVGLNSGAITQAKLNGTVTGQMNVGGLAGENQNTIQSFAVNVVTDGNSNVGGVTGDNSGTVEDGYALGAVNGTGNAQTDLGGIAGLNSGTVTIAYATGAVSGNATTSSNVGGDVGDDTTASGEIDQTYATGVVTGGTKVGGVAGSVDTSAIILQSYATGAVNGVTQVGGIAGLLTGAGQVNRSYASGVVTGNAGTTGGLLGVVNVTGSYSNLFWDSAHASVAVGTNGNPGSITNLHGETINTDTAAYGGFDSSGTPGFTIGVDDSSRVYGSADLAWRIQSGSEFPFLTQLSTQVSGTSYSDAAHTVLATGATVTLNSGGNLLNTTTTNGTTAAYDFLFAADDGLFNYIPLTGPTLRISDAAHDADAIAAENFNANGVPNLLADIAPADTWGNTVRVVTNGLNNTLLAGAGSAFITVPTVNTFGGTNLNISENFDVGSSGIISTYSINGNITAQGNVAFDSNGGVPSTYEQPVTLDAAATGGNPSPTFTLNATLSSPDVNRSIVVETAGSFINNVGVSAFSTPSGSWIVYSQNPEGSGQTTVDDTNGLNQLHLYGTNFMETPAYLLAPGLNYQVYSFVPTLTLTAVATGANSAGTLSVVYGTSAPTLTYSYDPSDLLPGDTVTPGATFNQVLSNQPGNRPPMPSTPTSALIL